MKFRTEIGKIKGGFTISHRDRIVLLGSCFADNIGELLARDGFNVIHNPLGPLFNPSSIDAVLSRGMRPFTTSDFTEVDGEWHCLWFAHRFRASDPATLAEMVNAEYLPLSEALAQATVIIVTFGTTHIFTYGEPAVVAGNCHKLLPSFFKEKYLSVEEIVALTLADCYPEARRIVTVSPVRYPGMGLPASFLSKATLRVAADKISAERNYDYFPAFEILNDDLRDYRFYAADMRHPSSQAVDYVYECFAETYFTQETKQEALRCRKEALRLAHIPLSER